MFAVQPPAPRDPTREPEIDPFVGVRYPRGTQFELYDLSNDPMETRNLAAQKHDMTRELAAALDAWTRSFRHYAASPMPRTPSAGGAARRNQGDAGLGLYPVRRYRRHVMKAEMACGRVVAIAATGVALWIPFGLYLVLL